MEPIPIPEEADEPRNGIALVIIALLLSPFSLMLFMGRGRLALLYAVLQFLWFVAALFILRAFNAPLARLGFDIDIVYFAMALVPAIVALIHALAIRRSSLARPFYSRWFVALVGAPLLVLAVTICFRTIAYQPFTIPSGSMHPTLIVGDYVFASKWAYGWSRFSAPWRLATFHGRIWGKPPERGDIVVYRLPRDENADYVSRVVGLPGDRIRVSDGVVYIDGIAAKKERIEDFIEPVSGLAQPQYRETLPNGVSYRVLDLKENTPGDNTDEYLVPAGHYFMLGDSRDNSMDSRFQQVGFIPGDHLIGRVELIYWNVFAVPVDGRLGGSP